MFDAAARLGNFRLAAEEVNLTQGAVAQQVRKLEEQLGIQLFSRLPRGVTLTEAGTQYHRDIRRALEIIDRATEHLRPEVATVVLSVPPSLASKWLVPRLSHLAAEHPDITLDLRASERLTDFVRDRVDLAIRQGRIEESKGLVASSLASLDLCAVASPTVAQSVSDQSLTDFTDMRLIEDGHRHWTTLFETAELSPPPVSLSFNQTALAIDAALAGQGVALAPRLLVRDAIEAGQLQELWQVDTQGEGYFLLYPDQPHPARDIVIGWLLKQE